MPRKLREIVEDAEALIAPPPDSVKLFRKQFVAYAHVAHRARRWTANMRPPGELRDRAIDDLKTLHRIRERHAGARPPYLAALNRLIIEVDAATCIVVPPGGPKRNLTAHVAAFMARGLINPPAGVDCPWRRPATLYDEGAWLRLASLIYEAATGEYARDMLKACREVDEPPQPYIARLRFQPPI